MATSNRTTRSTQAKPYFRSTPQMPELYFRCVSVPATTKLAEGLQSVLDSGAFSFSDEEIRDIQDTLTLSFTIRQSSVPALIKAFTGLLLSDDESAPDAAAALNHLAESCCAPNRA